MSYTRRTLLLGGIASITSLALSEVAGAISPDINHGSRSSEKVALTFHGAGDPSIASALLKIFQETSTPVTVFAVGTFLKANPNFAKEIVDAGHDLGNHTMTHTQMKTISAKRVDQEISQCAELLNKLIGNHGSFFRPSGTQFSTALIRKSAKKFGYQNCISYDVGSSDLLDPGKDAVISNVAKAAKGGSIISLHFGHKNTVAAMPLIIENLNRKGLKPVTLTELLGSK